MPGPIFVDTWGWIALGHRKNPRHYEVKGFYQEMRKEGSRVYTSDYVLDEVVTLLFRREAFTDLTSMAVMEERGLNDILTEDEHFIQAGMGFQRLP